MPNVDFAKKAVVKVQKRSAFDKSFRNLLTTKCGTLTPLLCDEVIPNTTVNLKLALNATLPPLASETFMNVNLKAEAFFVPTRLLMRGWTEFVQGNTAIKAGVGPNYTDNKIRVPVISLTPGVSSYFAPGSLLDYLGFRASVTAGTVNICALPVLCYNLLFDTWYRNPLVQKSVFADENIVEGGTTYHPKYMRSKTPCDKQYYGYMCTPGLVMNDGVAFCALRQRNFGSDYFTTATPSPQNGPAQKISMQLPSSMTAFSNGGYITGDFSSEDNLETLTWDEGTMQGTGAEFSLSLSNSSSDITNPSMSFTISSLRACNALQQWLERNQLSNNQYVSFLKSQYNADLKDSIAQRPVYLGSASFPVYSKGVYQTAKDSSSSNNPFDSVASRYGHAYAEGSSFIIDHYTAQEHGYIMVLVSVVPEVTYSGGVNKYLMRYVDAESYGEVANPILQSVGPEPIRLYEFDYQINDDDSFGVFGYTDRFSSWMTRNNELHSLLRDGQSLESFALQRTGLSDGIGTSFLQIPTNYMDQVTAVDSSISNYGVWIDSWLDYKIVQPLGKYVIPSLQDPAYEHGDTVVVNKRGRIME